MNFPASLVQSALLEGIPHGFTTRTGGVSTGSLHALNMAMREHETPDGLTENWRRVLLAMGFEGSVDRVALLNQVHGAAVEVIRHPLGVLNTVAHADGAVTDAYNVVLAVRTADCVPVLFASPGGVGVAHAGWRGVAASVVPRTVQALCDLTGDAPEMVLALVGPHISQQAYEVGAEVVDGIVAAGVPERVFVRQEQKPHVSLGEAVCYQLRAAGVHKLAIEGGCTFGDLNLFSHRRDGVTTGRLAGVIARPPVKGH